MISSVSLTKSSSSSSGVYRENPEDRGQSQTALKVSQTSETVLRKRGREEELSSQKRRKTNEPFEYQVTSKKESKELTLRKSIKIA